jgi:DNA polymerase V
MSAVLSISAFPQGPRPWVPIPFVTARVCAGFPSPADDYLDGVIDLNELCISQPAATFFVRASGASMSGGLVLP